MPTAQHISRTLEVEGPGIPHIVPLHPPEKDNWLEFGTLEKRMIYFGTVGCGTIPKREVRPNSTCDHWALITD